MTQESIESNFTSIHATVQFLDILEQYSFNKDLSCHYKVNDYKPKEGDKVSIFKIGWTSVNDFIIFMWAPTIGSRTEPYTVTFDKNTLPKNCTEVYQICYISNENELHGASTPFQFESGVNKTFIHEGSSFEVTNDMSIIINKKNQEIERLKEDNDLLKKMLKTLLSSKEVPSKNYDEEIKNLRKLTESLNNMLLQQQEDINMMKIKIEEGRQEYIKLYQKKNRIERKYEKLKQDNEVSLSSPKSLDVPNCDIGELKSIPPFPSILN